MIAASDETDGPTGEEPSAPTPPPGEDTSATEPAPPAAAGEDASALESAPAGAGEDASGLEAATAAAGEDGSALEAATAAAGEDASAHDSSPRERGEDASGPEPPPATPAGDRPAGWYPDPEGSGWRRYWDGTAWTSASPEQLASEPGAAGARAAWREPTAARVLIALGVLVAVVVVIVIAVSGSSKPSATSSSLSTAATSARPATVSTTATVTTPSAVTAAEVTGAVNAYVAAYNARSVSALSALFAPTLVRRVVGHSPQNLATALRLYSGQFATESTPNLALADLKVSPAVGSALAGASYGVRAHNRRTRGRIVFHFIRSGPKLLIDRLTVTVH